MSEIAMASCLLLQDAAKIAKNAGCNRLATCDVPTERLRMSADFFTSLRKWCSNLKKVLCFRKNGLHLMNFLHLEPIFVYKVTLFVVNDGAFVFMMGSKFVKLQLWSPFRQANFSNYYVQLNKMGSVFCKI